MLAIHFHGVQKSSFKHYGTMRVRTRVANRQDNTIRTNRGQDVAVPE